MESLAMTPLVSIVVRTKDRPRLLERALASVAAQTHRPLEVVLVNDGGAAVDLGELRRILGDVSLQYRQLTTSQGRAHAANVGIELATGRFVGFLDDDDELYPAHVEVLVAVLSPGGFKVAYTDVEMVFVEPAGSDGSPSVDGARMLFSRDFSLSDLLIGNYIPFNALLFDAQVLRSVGGIDPSFELYEDWDLLIRVAKQHPFAHCQQLTARYNQWSQAQQINRADPDRMRSMCVRIFDKHRSDITGDVLLDYRDRRDAAEAALRSEVGSVRSLASEQAARIEQLEETLRERESRVLELETAIETRDARLAMLDSLAEARDAHIKSLEQVLRESESQLRGTRQTLDAMNASLGWRVVVALRDGRERLFPGGSVRRRMADLGLHSLVVLYRDGAASFSRAAARKIRGFGRHLPALARRAYSVYRAHGTKVMLARVRDYLARNALTRAGAVQTIVAAGERYAQWMARNEGSDEADVRKAIEQLAHRPLISIVTPVYNVDPRWLNRCVESVRAQRYPYWQLCLLDDASTNEATRRALVGWQGVDDRIVISWGDKNSGIAAASNAALKMAEGEFIALLDHDDELSPDALFEVARLLNEHPETDLVYSDEDRITVTGESSTLRHDPFFKPDWSPQLLFACMYTGHLSVYRRALVNELGGFRSEFDFSQDYDLALRVTERTDRIRHLPKVLYHWRALPESAAGGGKDFARASNIAALQAACDRRGYDAQALALPSANRVKFRVPQPPLVSIVIPSDSRRTIFSCIQLLQRSTAYRPFEIVVVTNSTLGREIEARFPGDATVRICAFDKPFNFSLKCNEGAAFANGELLLFLNDDVEAVDPGWLEAMVGVLAKGNVGGVSPKLFYENDTVQYAGMITGVRGLVGTAFHTEPKDSTTYFNFIQSERNVSLLCGACLLMPRHVFEQVGGFDAVNTPIMHSDVDLSCRIRERGYEMVYTPFAALRHIGHLSLKATDDRPERRKDKADTYLIKRWGHFLSRDPFFPENMSAQLYHAGHVPYRMSARRQDDILVAAKDILLVSHDLSLSGAPILLFYLAQHLRAQGYFVTVMSPLDGDLAQGYESHNIPVIIDATLAYDPLPDTRKLMAAFDVIVVNTIVAWPSVLAARESGTPVLWVLHESQAGVEMARADPRVVQALGASSDVVFACAATRSLYDVLGRNAHFHVIPYGTRALPEIPNIEPDRSHFTVVHIGSVEPRKGQDLLLDAIARLPPECTARLRVLMIGRVLDPAFHERLLPALRAAPCVSYLGPVPHEQIPRHLAAADVFVSSSRDEVFPVTVMEAMSLGKPVIGTAVGGVPEMIRHGVDGLVVPPGNSVALGEAIAALCSDPQRCKRMGEAARQHYTESFSFERFGQRIVALIEPRLRAAMHPTVAT
jgi:glycosyltransferase involved in cell wall biosynthesis/GT2 family glycosyltransferase